MGCQKIIRLARDILFRLRQSNLNSSIWRQKSFLTFQYAQTEVRLTKPEAAAVIKIFFDEFNKIDWLIRLIFLVGHRSYTTIRNKIRNAHKFCKCFLCLPETTFINFYDNVINIPLGATRSKAMKPNFIFTVHIYPETVLGVIMKRTEGTIPFPASWPKPYIQKLLTISDNPINVSDGF